MRAAVLCVCLAACHLGEDGPITDAEKAPPAEVEKDGARWLEHPALKFSLKHPGPAFTAQHELARQNFGQQKDSAAWAWIDPTSGGALMMIFAKGIGPDDLETFVNGVKIGMLSKLKELAGDVAPKLEKDEIAKPDAEIHMVLGDMHVRVRAHAGRFGSTRKGTLAIVTLTASGDGMADVATSLRTP